MEERKCTKCGKSFDISFFYKDKTRPSGLHPWCRSCASRASSSWLQKNRDKANAAQDRYRKNHPDLVKKGVKEAYYRDPQKGRERARLYKQENPEKVKAYKAHYRSIPENRKKILETERKWRAKSGKQKEYDMRRRSLKKSLPSTLTAEQWEFAVQVFESSCAYCGKKRDLCAEHLIPLSRKDISNNPGTVLENIVPSCKSCNSRKYNKTHYEYCTKEQLAYILSKLEVYHNYHKNTFTD